MYERTSFTFAKRSGMRTIISTLEPGFLDKERKPVTGEPEGEPLELDGYLRGADTSQVRTDFLSSRL